MEMSSSKDRFEGDLSDIVRASYGRCSTVTAGACTSSSEADSFSHHHHEWMLVSDPSMEDLDLDLDLDLSCVLDQEHRGSFGDPFSNMTDPFLLQHHHNNTINMPAAAAAAPYYLNNRSPSSSAVIGSGDNNNCVAEDDDNIFMMMRRAPSYCNNNNNNNNNMILSNMIQISPKPTKLPFSSSTCCDAAAASTSSNNKDHGLLVEHNNTGAALVQISSSPRNNNPAAAALKRRKSQAKKSICIPAPTAPNSSRQSGEVVPSDLWAWRKYGQKPIKGSPYPRGYYRCSSSKGCPARKQVERSRTEPNMLVITYTCEHNHPWPTQRNALAASSRSHPSKTIHSHSASSNKINSLPQEEEQDQSNISTDNSANNGSSVKLEEIDDGMMEMEMDIW